MNIFKRFSDWWNYSKKKSSPLAIRGVNNIKIDRKYVHKKGRKKHTYKYSIKYTIDRSIEKNWFNVFEDEEEMKNLELALSQKYYNNPKIEPYHFRITS